VVNVKNRERRQMKKVIILSLLGIVGYARSMEEDMKKPLSLGLSDLVRKYRTFDLSVERRKETLTNLSLEMRTALAFDMVKDGKNDYFFTIAQEALEIQNNGDEDYLRSCLLKDVDDVFAKRDQTIDWLGQYGRVIKDPLQSFKVKARLNKFLEKSVKKQKESCALAIGDELHGWDKGEHNSWKKREVVAVEKKEEPGCGEVSAPNPMSLESTVNLQEYVNDLYELFKDKMRKTRKSSVRAGSQSQGNERENELQELRDNLDLLKNTPGMGMVAIYVEKQIEALEKKQEEESILEAKWAQLNEKKVKGDGLLAASDLQNRYDDAQRELEKLKKQAADHMRLSIAKNISSAQYHGELAENYAQQKTLKEKIERYEISLHNIRVVVAATAVENGAWKKD